MSARKEQSMSKPSLPRRSARALWCFSALAIAAGGPALAAGPADSAPSADSRRCSTPLEERNLALFKEYLAALTSGALPDTSRYFTPDAVVVSYGSVVFAGTYLVTNGAWAAVQQAYWDFADMAPMLEEPVLYADCDKVILNGQFKRKARATGQTVDTRVIEYFTFDREGKIVRDDFYLADTAAVNAVLGTSR
jgi:ketosteroid isomerase-like protein